ncbi:MAG: 2-isopropylmalate synthase [Myxococcota bacterium]|jgi:2-isopropylmalate synthase
MPRCGLALWDPGYCGPWHARPAGYARHSEGGVVMEPESNRDQLVWDWNSGPRDGSFAPGRVKLHDETLRDGLQAPSVTDPTIEEKKRLVELADALGVYSINIGLPGAGPRPRADTLELAKHIRDKKLTIKASCAARTLRDDIRPIVEVSQQVGIEIEVMAFVGASPIRQYVEGWTTDHIERLSRTAIEFGVSEGLPVTYVTEDTTRSAPQTLDTLFKSAIDAGAHRLCLCDTCGHATPSGARRLIQFTRNLLDDIGSDAGIDWHGHDDRGLALTNALRAAEYGADRIHGTALGIGERVGNAPLDLLLVNLVLLGAVEPKELAALVEFCELSSTALGVPIPIDYPVFGADAFRTATGVHAAAVVKAQLKGDDWLADRIYSGIPASMFGKHQIIEVGPMSGLSNVRYWLSTHGIETSDATARAVLARAKQSPRSLTDREIRLIVAGEDAA